MVGVSVSDALYPVLYPRVGDDVAMNVWREGHFLRIEAFDEVIKKWLTNNS